MDDRGAVDTGRARHHWRRAKDVEDDISPSHGFGSREWAPILGHLPSTLPRPCPHGSGGECPLEHPGSNEEDCVLIWLDFVQRDFGLWYRGGEYRVYVRDAGFPGGYTVQTA